MRYRILLKDHLRMLSHLIITDGILSGLYIWHFGFVIPTPFFYWIFLAIFLTQIIPTIWLHTSYFSINKKTVLIFDEKNRRFHFSENGILTTVPFDEVASIQLVASFGAGTGVYSFGEYCFCNIKTETKKEFTITSLLMSGLNNKIKTNFADKLESKFKILALA